MSNGDYLKEESGGKTKVVLVSRVHKEAADERMLKLVDEYEFIESIPDEFKEYFPRILLYGVEGNKAFYEMEHYDLPTLRRLMLSNQIFEDELLYWADKITAVSRRMYEHKVIPTPDDYFDVMHFTRLDNRLKDLSKKSDYFRDLIQQKEVVVNWYTLHNIPVLVEKFKNEKFLSTVQPEFVGRWSHSDLHFSNVLIDRANDRFILIDPRGYDYCDYYYDYGKFWHSVNGKYEMIASRKFLFQEPDIFRLEKGQMQLLCESLKKSLPKILYKHSPEDPEDVMRKTEWNEVMHFASLVPFLLDYDGEDARAKVAYLTSVCLINEFCEKYEIH